MLSWFSVNQWIYVGIVLTNIVSVELEFFRFYPIATAEGIKRILYTFLYVCTTTGGLFQSALCLMYITCCRKELHGQCHIIVKDNFSMSEDKVPVLVPVGK
jgi:hypothetical protein